MTKFAVLLKSGRFIDMEGAEKDPLVVTWQMMDEYQASLSGEIFEKLKWEGAEGERRIAAGTMSAPEPDAKLYATLQFFDRYDPSLKHVLGNKIINLIRAKICGYPSPEVRKWMLLSLDQQK